MNHLKQLCASAVAHIVHRSVSVVSSRNCLNTHEVLLFKLHDYAQFYAVYAAKLCLQ
jgi:hypothetical protein